MGNGGDLSAAELEAAVCIVDRVALYTAHFPDRPLMTWVDAKCREETSFTYSEFQKSRDIIQPKKIIKKFCSGAGTVA